MGVLVAVDTDRDDAGGWRAGHDTPCGGRWPRRVRTSRGGGQYCDEAYMPGFYQVTPSAWWRGMRLGAWPTDLPEGIRTPVVPWVRPTRGRIHAHPHPRSTASHPRRCGP